MKAFSKALSAAIVAGGAVVTAQAFGISCPPCALSNVDYFGHDVDKLFGGPGTESPEACQKACQKNTYCHFFTYITDRRECYLKDADATRDPKYHATAISGPKHCGNHPILPNKPPQYPQARPPIYVPKPLPPLPVPPLPGKPIPPAVLPIPPNHPSFDMPTLCFRDNIDYFGFDLKKFEGGMAPTPLACQHLCAQEKECFYWTFTRNDKTCYLKTRGATQGSRTNTNAISGPKVCNMVPQTCFERDTDYYGCDLRAVEGHLVVSAEECQKICQSYPDCKYWTWVSIQRNCYLKSEGAIHNRIHSPGSVSGPRICDGNFPPCNDPPKYVPPTCFDYNVEYVHGTLRTCEAPNLKACQAICRAEPGCEYVTFKLDLLECALKSDWALSNKAYRKFTYSTSKQCDLNQQPGKYPPGPPLPPPYLDGVPVPESPVPFPPFLDGKPIPPPQRPFPPFLDGKPIPPPPQPYPPFLDGKPIPPPPQPYPPYLDGKPVPPPPQPFPPFLDGMPVPESPAPFPPQDIPRPAPVPRPPPPVECIEPDMDYTGSTIGSTTCNSIATCQRVCQLTAGCHYYSYVEPLRQCNLKGEKGVARPCPGTISGPEICPSSGLTTSPDICYHYAVIVGDSIGSDVAYSAPICQNLCMSKPGCAYFTYGLNNGECIYFKNKHHHVPSPFSISGLRACSGGPTDDDWGFPNPPPQVPSLPSKPYPPPPPSAGCVHVDMDFTGHNVGIEIVPHFENCRDACMHHDECHCFTYVESTGQCYLKSETGHVHPNKGCISGLKFCQ